MERKAIITDYEFTEGKGISGVLFPDGNFKKCGNAEHNLLMSDIPLDVQLGCLYFSSNLKGDGDGVITHSPVQFQGLTSSQLAWIETNVNFYDRGQRRFNTSDWKKKHREERSMIIEEGKFYINRCTEEGLNETYIMLVLPRKEWTPVSIYRTETLALHCDMRMWQNEWLEEYFQREASPEEIQIFMKERAKYGIELQGVGTMVTGGAFKSDKNEDLPKLIDYIS